MEATYILPIRYTQINEDLDELTHYLSRLADQLELIIVDGSPSDIFAVHHMRWNSFGTHIPPDADIQCANGKVRGVLTGLRRAMHECVVIADDDVRYDTRSLERVVALLEQADIVRPQNYFDPLPWHAYWDTARTLLNRMTGGDWPGTVGVRLSLLKKTNGYDGDMLFENLELVRTIRAVGGKELVAFNLFVRRKPPSTHHFWSQRVRQAYDEFARPVHLLVSLAILPLTLSLAFHQRWSALLTALAGVICVAEIGRRWGKGHLVFPFLASLLAPAWLMERAISIWIALGMRLILGGVPYHGTVLTHAATSERVLRQRYGERPPHSARSLLHSSQLQGMVAEKDSFQIEVSGL